MLFCFVQIWFIKKYLPWHFNTLFLHFSKYFLNSKTQKCVLMVTHMLTYWLIPSPSFVFWSNKNRLSFFLAFRMTSTSQQLKKNSLVCDSISLFGTTASLAHSHIHWHESSFWEHGCTISYKDYCVQTSCTSLYSTDRTMLSELLPSQAWKSKSGTNFS